MLTDSSLTCPKLKTKMTVEMKKKQQLDNLWNKPLTGQALLIKVKRLSGYTRKEKAKICGYVNIANDGSERINLMAFFNAILEAEGINLDRDSSKHHRLSKRQPSYKTIVHSNGTLCIGATYTKQLDLKPGDKLHIVLERKNIFLTKIDES